MKASLMLVPTLLICAFGSFARADNAAGVSAAIGAAVADPARPQADRERDANRKPAETLAFAGVAPREKIGELLPGGGYFTRILSQAVGRQGAVYAVAPPAKPGKTDYSAGVRRLPSDPHYANVTVLAEPLSELHFPVPLDLIWTSQNYHDLHNIPGFSVAALNKAVYDALRPGGVYLVLDHAAAPGSGIRDTGTLHRIDPQTVKTEVLAAGFVLDASSDLLHRPGDAHTATVFDPSIRGRTDQFIFRFRKPGGR